MTALDAHYSPLLVNLLKGVVWRDDDPNAWNALSSLQGRIRDYVTVIGLDLIVDDGEGYAYLRQRSSRPEDPDLPRLVPRRQLSFHVSLLLALLRRRLAELDARAGDARLVVRRDELVEMARIFFEGTGNDVRFVAKIDALIEKVVKLGFLRPLKGQDGHYEVRRIIKAFVDAQWLHDLDARLAGYHEHANEVGATREAPEDA